MTRDHLRLVDGETVLPPARPRLAFSQDKPLRRRLLPGDAGGLDDAEIAALQQTDIELLTAHPPCALMAKRPRPICAETEGDCS